MLLQVYSFRRFFHGNIRKRHNSLAFCQMHSCQTRSDSLTAVRNPNPRWRPCWRVYICDYNWPAILALPSWLVAMGDSCVCKKHRSQLTKVPSLCVLKILGFNTDAYVSINQLSHYCFPVSLFHYYSVRFLVLNYSCILSPISTILV